MRRRERCLRSVMPRKIKSRWRKKAAALSGAAEGGAPCARQGQQQRSVASATYV